MISNSLEGGRLASGRTWRTCRRLWYTRKKAKMDIKGLASDGGTATVVKLSKGSEGGLPFVTFEHF